MTDRLKLSYKSLTCCCLNFIVLFILTQTTHASSTSFIVIGHLYPITSNSGYMEKLFVKIHSLNPDYVFVLGDSSITDSYIYTKYYQSFGDKIYSLPGNSEMINGTLDDYEKNVGYLNKVVNTENVNFILLNSLENITSIKRYLINAINKNNKDKYNILLTHHRIWDDTLTSKFPYEHDKSYYFKEIYPLIKGKIKAIFSGNSKRQYFSDSKWGNVGQNVNNIYWVDQIGNISCYSVGTGDAYPKLGFVYGEIDNNKLYLEPHHVNYFGVDPIPIEMIIKNKTSVAPNVSDIKIITKQNKITFTYIIKYLRSLRKLYFVLIGVIMGLLLRPMLILSIFIILTKLFYFS